MAAILVRLGSGEVGREGGWWVVVSVGGEVSLVMARKWDQWGKNREGDEEEKKLEQV